MIFARSQPYLALRSRASQWIWTDRGWVLGFSGVPQQKLRGIPRRAGMGADQGACPDGYVDDGTGTGTCVLDTSNSPSYTPGTPPVSPPSYVPAPPPPPSYVPVPVPNTPPSPSSTTTTSMSTGEIVGIGVAVVAAAGLIGYAVHEQRKPGSHARRAASHVRRAASHVRARFRR